MTFGGFFMEYDELFSVDPRVSYHSIQDRKTRERINDIANISKSLFLSEEEEHTEFIHRYQDLIQRISAFVVEKVGLNEIGICAALAEMMWRGYFSIDQNFMYFYQNQANELLSFMGTSVFTGKVCCRHMCSFFNDILRNIRMNSSIIGNFFFDLDGSLFDTCISRYNIDGRLLSNSFFNYYDFESNGQMNHTGVMFDYHRYTLIFDPTNIRFFSIKNIQGVELDGKGKIVINPFSLALFSGFSVSLIEKRMDNIKKKNIPKNTSPIRSLFYHGIESIINDLSSCDDFYTGIEQDIHYMNDYIVKKLK